MDEYHREEAYRIYVTESLSLAPQQKYLKKGYRELLSEGPKEEKTGDEIALEVILGAGLTFGE